MKKFKRTGKCCQNIGLTVSPSTLEASYRTWISQGVSGKEYHNALNSSSTQTISQPTIYHDIHLIFPMLEFLYQDFIHPNGNEKIEVPVFHYRCRHHNKKTGDCMINGIKPSMCLSFPDGRACKYKGCSCAGDGRKAFEEVKKHFPTLKKKLKKLEEDKKKMVEKCDDDCRHCDDKKM